jgi:hypothetical protein
MRNGGQMIDMIDPVEGTQDGCAIEDRARDEFDPFDGASGGSFVEYPNEVAPGPQGGNQMPSDETVSAGYQ